MCVWCVSISFYIYTYINSHTNLHIPKKHQGIPFGSAVYFSVVTLATVRFPTTPRSITYTHKYIHALFLYTYINIRTRLWI